MFAYENRGGTQTKLEKMIKTLWRLHEPSPITIAAPTLDDIEATQNELGIKFHPDYVKFLREASTVCYGIIEPLTIGKNLGNLDFRKAFKESQDTDGFPVELFPICEDNADYYCMYADGSSSKVLLWSYESNEVSEEWPDLASWIEEVWLEEGE